MAYDSMFLHVFRLCVQKMHLVQYSPVGGEWTKSITSPPSCPSPLFASSVSLSHSLILEWCNWHHLPAGILYFWVFFGHRVPLPVSNFDQWMMPLAVLHSWPPFSLIHDNCTQINVLLLQSPSFLCCGCHFPELFSMQATPHGHGVDWSSNLLILAISFYIVLVYPFLFSVFLIDQLNPIFANLLVGIFPSLQASHCKDTHCPRSKHVYRVFEN